MIINILAEQKGNQKGDLGDAGKFCTFVDGILNTPTMFVRKKRNRTGTISVVVIDKKGGKYKEVKNFGVVTTEREADVLFTRAKEWISRYGGQQVLDLGANQKQIDELRETQYVFDNIESVLMNAPQLLLNPIYDSIGFNRIPDKTLRQKESLNRRREGLYHEYGFVCRRGSVSVSRIMGCGAGF